MTLQRYLDDAVAALPGANRDARAGRRDDHVRRARRTVRPPARPPRPPRRPAGRSRRRLSRQVDRHGGVDLRDAQGRRGLRAGRSVAPATRNAYILEQLFGEGGGHREALRGDPAQRARGGGARPTLFVLDHVGGGRRAARRRWTPPMRRRRARRRRACIPTPTHSRTFSTRRGPRASPRA